MSKSSQRRETIREIKRRYSRIRREGIDKDIEPIFKKQLSQMEQQELEQARKKK